MLDANVESLTNLRDNFADQGVNLDEFPMVIQYNKRDLPDIMSVDELNAALNPRGVPCFEAVARTGEGVLKTFTGVSKLVLQDMQKFPERHNFTLGDIIGQRRQGSPAAPAPKLLLPNRPCPARPWRKRNPRWPRWNRQWMPGSRSISGNRSWKRGRSFFPFELLTQNRQDQFQLRVTIDMEAPLSKRFKIVVKNFRK